MVPFKTDRTIIIGQCSGCKEIHWLPWITGAREPVWTGRTMLEPARPMYSKGQGA
jgi:hypothetical protein